MPSKVWSQTHKTMAAPSTPVLTASEHVLCDRGQIWRLGSLRCLMLYHCCVSLEPRTLGCAGTSLGRHREEKQRKRAVEDSTISTVCSTAVTWSLRNKSVADTNMRLQCNPSIKPHNTLYVRLIDKIMQHNVRLSKEQEIDISELDSRTQTDFELQRFIFYLPYRLTSVAKFTRFFL